MRRPSWQKIALGLVSLLLFVLAIQLMKEGAKTIAPFVQGWFDVDNGANSLGFGWLSAYIILSGSPVAAVALTFFDAGFMGEFETFCMITGSRLGASFIVLFLGLLYTLRGHERFTTLSMGLLTFLITFSLHLPGLGIGYVLLAGKIANPIHLSIGVSAASVLEMAYAPIVGFLLARTPGWLAFLLGVGVIMLSFSLFDRALPQLKLESTDFAQIPRVIYRPLIMFLMGAVVTAVSMSVAISLSILVPLSARGYIRSENAIAYIMGANVSTFVDTLLVALLLGNPMAATIVLVQIGAVTVIALTTLFILYRPHERAMLFLTSRIANSNRNMIIFAVSILIVPLLLMVV